MLLNSFEPRELKDGQKTQPHSSADQGAAGAGKKDYKSEYFFNLEISGLKLQKLVEDDDDKSSGGEWLGGAEQKGWWKSRWSTRES